MIIHFVVLLIILGLALLLPLFSKMDIFNNATYALGIIMLTGYVSGNLVKKIRFPKVTGYILIGILIGPFGLELFTQANVQDLQLLNGLALSIIALTAGGEIRFSGLKKNFKSIYFILICQTILIMLGIVSVVFIFQGLAPIFKGLDATSVLASALLIGIICTASSPSTTLAVIVESKKRNRYTELILSIVMLKDIIILFLFVIGLSISRALVGNVGFNPSKVASVFFEIAGSLGCGGLVGLIIVLYLKWVKKRDAIIFILAISFFAYEIFEPLHLHPLLIMMVAGFIVENFSNEGDRLMQSLKALSPPVYVIFFTLAGASTNLAFLRSFWLFAVILVLFRLILKHLSTYLGSWLACEEEKVKKSFGMAFISQAGLSLGMATIIERTFGTFGQRLAVLIISIIVINQVIGPMLLKWVLERVDPSR